MRVWQSFAFLAAASFMLGMGNLVPAEASPLPPPKANFFTMQNGEKLQTVHCRRYLHTHRRCTLWRRGVCRRSVTFRHRCG